MAEEAAGSSPLFAVFFLSIYSLFLIPFTIYKLRTAATPDQVVKPWEAGEKQASAISRFLRKFLTTKNVGLVALWLLWVAVVWYVQLAAKEVVPFDPYEILQVSRDASEKDIRRAYRVLAVQYHPDKNPDPAAAQYFAERITKAHKALTDEASRENYEKYGHPDGPQALNMGIALPEWIFSKDKQTAPIILAALVGGGILLPLIAAACFLMSSKKYLGPNNIMGETLNIFIHSKWAVKESQSLARIPDTLVMAVEFITLPTPAEQGPGLEELRKTVLRIQPDLKEKPQWWKRKSSILKVHMLLLAHLAREEVPASLAADMKLVLKLAPALLDEMRKIANVPRHPSNPYGWLTPTVGCLEMMQCLVQAVPLSTRKAARAAGGTDAGPPLIQLPHVDGDVVKRLARRRVRGLPDLLALPPEERVECFTSAGAAPFGPAHPGLTDAQAHEASTSLSSIPMIALWNIDCKVDGEEGEVMDEDIVTCSCRVTLTRASHAEPGAAKPTGTAVQAYAPYFPYPKQEKWHFVLADPANNQVLGMAEAVLLEAEAAGMDLAAAAATALCSRRRRLAGPEAEAKGPLRLAEGSAESPGPHLEGSATSPDAAAGQLVEVRFRAPGAGKYDLTLYCLSDSWVGCDRTAPVRLRVAERSRAEREGRVPRPGKAPPPLAALEGREDGAAAALPDAGREPGGLIGTEPVSEGSEPEEDEDEDDEEGDWDSEETGTEVSGSDEEEEAAPPGELLANGHAGAAVTAEPAAPAENSKRK